MGQVAPEPGFSTPALLCLYPTLLKLSSKAHWCLAQLVRLLLKVTACEADRLAARPAATQCGNWGCAAPHLSWCVQSWVGFPGGGSQSRRQETRVWFLWAEDLLEEGRATHSSVPFFLFFFFNWRIDNWFTILCWPLQDSSILAWKIPWTDKPGGLQPMRRERVKHNWSNHQIEMSSFLKVDLSQSSRPEASAAKRKKKSFNIDLFMMMKIN